MEWSDKTSILGVNVNYSYCRKQTIFILLQGASKRDFGTNKEE